MHTACILKCRTEKNFAFSLHTLSGGDTLKDTLHIKSIKVFNNKKKNKKLCEITIILTQAHQTADITC
jgi:hypothetical protein